MSGAPIASESIPVLAHEVTPRDWRRSAVLACLVSMLVGLVISVWPHVVWWNRIGEPVYMADHDDGFYLAFTSQAYFEHPTRITDPILKSGGTSQFPAAQLVPAVLLARALNLGPFGVLLVWRVWGGLTIGLTCYLLSLWVVKRPWLAAAVAVLFATDSGVTVAKPIVKHVALAAKYGLSGLTEGDVGARPQIMKQWRLITPSVSLAFLLAHVTLTLRAREKPSRTRIALAGISYGLLFYVYFYFWTAATVALGLLWLFDAGRRRVPLAIGVIGFIVGLPTLVVNIRFKRDYAHDWLDRMDNFLPIPRTSEWQFPLATIAILAVAVPWAYYRRKDLLYLACMAVAGLLMANHQIATGLQIQNWHWFYVWAPLTWLLVVFEVLPFVSRRPIRSRAVIVGLTLALLVFGAAGLSFRAAESTRSEDSKLLQKSYVSYRKQKRRPDWPGLVPNEVLAGDPDFLEMAVIWDDQRPLDHYALLSSPDTLEPEHEERVALNAFLRGMSPETFRAWQTEQLSAGWGPWTRDPAMRREKLGRMVTLLEHYPSDLARSLARFQVRYVALPAGASSAHLKGRWRRLQAGQSWDIYEFLDRDVPGPTGS